jgi:hypothetical protein
MSPCDNTDPVSDQNSVEQTDQKPNIDLEGIGAFVRKKR